jgi:hypothetical protein
VVAVSLAALREARQPETVTPVSGFRTSARIACAIAWPILKDFRRVRRVTNRLADYLIAYDTGFL